MRKILGLDIGKKKIGIALSDLLGMTAQPQCTIRSKNLDEQIEKILSIIKENNIQDVVVGLPKNMQGEDSEQSIWTKGFVDKMLEKNNEINIIYIDERFTSKLALSNLSHMNMKKIKDKELIDSLAASSVLETYLRQKENGVR